MRSTKMTLGGTTFWVNVSIGKKFLGVYFSSSCKASVTSAKNGGQPVTVDRISVHLDHANSNGHHIRRRGRASKAAVVFRRFGVPNSSTRVTAWACVTQGGDEECTPPENK